MVTTSGGHGLLHWAAMCGNTPAIATIAAWPGADVNLRNSAGETPLMLAVKTKNAAAVSALLAVAGVDLEVEEGDWSLEDLARRWMACTGRRDSRFRAEASREMLGLLSQARSASQQAAGVLTSVISVLPGLSERGGGSGRFHYFLLL